MARVAMRPLLVLGAAIGLLVAACSPATDDTSLGQTGTSPRYGTPFAGGATPGGEVLGARATVVATRTMATPGPLRVQALLQEMDQFLGQLRTLSGGAPTPSDVLGVVQRAADLMAALHQDIGQMSGQERDRALDRMGEITLEMSRVVDTHARLWAATAAPGMAMPTPRPRPAMPGPMMGTPGALTPGPMMMGTPVSGMMGPEQMMAAIDQMRAEMRRLAANQPSENDIMAKMDQMQLILVTMRQQLDQLSVQELEALTGNLAQAFDDLVPVVETHLRQETGAVPVVPSPTAMPTMTPSPAVPPTETPSPTAVPTMTPSPTAIPTATSTPMPSPTLVP